MSVRVFGLDLTQPRTTTEVVVANAMSKALVMVCAAAFAMVSTRLIIGHFGLATYAQYGLLVSMAALVPFADLGLGAAIMNTVAEAPSPGSREVGKVLLSALRILTCSAVVVMVVAVVITVGGWWSELLGSGLLAGGGAAAFGCALLFALRLPLGVGQRLLTGLGLNHVQIRLQFIQAPLFLAAVASLILVGGSGNFLAPLSYVGALVVAGGSVWIAGRRVGPNLRWAAARIGKWRTERGGRAMHVAWPMLFQMAALPIAFQSDRILLSHFASTNDLATYNLAAQLFGMVIQALTAAGIALWPIFAKSRSKSEIRSPFRLAVAFGLGTLILSIALALLLPWVVPIISDGRISIGVSLAASFTVFAALQGLKYPLGMYMTDIRGLRFQVVPIMVLVPLNIAISWTLIAPLGAAGPVIGSAISVALCQVVPGFWYVRKDMESRRNKLAAECAA